jgi:hypothetical protein
MKKKLFLLTLAAGIVLAMGSCKNGKSHQSSDDNEDEVTAVDDNEADEDDSQSADSQAERSDFKFKAKVVTDDEGVAEKIIVKIINTASGTTKEAEVAAVNLNPDQWNGFGEIREDDINFDGYPDLLVCCGPFNAYGNFTYGAWLWDEEQHDFKAVEGFDELFDPVFNEEDKTISSAFRMDDHEDDAVYKWKGDKLEMVSSETFVYDEEEE